MSREVARRKPRKLYGFSRTRLTASERAQAKLYWDWIHTDMTQTTDTTTTEQREGAGAATEAGAAKASRRTNEAATANAPTTLSSNPTSVEQQAQAEKILEAGYVKLGSARINVYTPPQLDEVPRVKTEELVGREIIVWEVPGTFESQEYGVAWRVTLSFADTPKERLSWLCDTKTVMGRQISEQKTRLPLWLTVREVEAKSGRSYYTFETPERLLRATGRWQSDASYGVSDDDELPF